MISSYPIESWGKIFKDFNLVKNVQVVSAAERLDITIKKRTDILQASGEELDDALHKFGGNQREVAAYFLRKHNVLVYYQDTLVCFFDIIGYSSFIKQYPIEECIEKIGDFIRSVNNFTATDIYDVKLDHWILSDSVILVVDTSRAPISTGSLEMFLAVCSELMATGIKAGFPLRGAIGGGDFYKDGEVMVSTALVDAARYEKEQEWLGTVLTPDALRIIEKARELEKKKNAKGETLIDFSSIRFSHFIRYGTIPWKNGGRLKEKPTEAYYIKPYDTHDVNWASKYLPAHFDSPQKINNSDCLYGQQ